MEQVSRESRQDKRSSDKTFNIASTMVRYMVHYAHVGQVWVSEVSQSVGPEIRCLISALFCYGV